MADVARQAASTWSGRRARAVEHGSADKREQRPIVCQAWLTGEQQQRGGCEKSALRRPPVNWLRISEIPS